MDIKLILDARESRVRLIHDMIRKHEKPIILVKGNIPGEKKNIKEAYMLVSIFVREIKQIFRLDDYAFFDSADGPYALMPIDGVMPIDLKKKLVDIEETHPLGRLIDLDLYVDETYSISRVELSITSRRCYICNEDARICSKTKKHTTESLILFIHESVANFMHQVLDAYIEDAMMKELNLEDKFGLVTPTSSGSHPDMNYALMLQAKDSIKPYILQMFDLNYQINDLEELFSKARMIGMIAEQKMLETTSGINAYKGLIFMLGLAVTAFGHVWMQGKTMDDLYQTIMTMTKDITKELNQSIQTHGKKAFTEHQLLGARGEAEKGLPTIKYLFKNTPHDINHDSDLRDMLKKIILNTEDTVFYHRSKNKERYEQIKSVIKNLDVKDMYQAKAFTKDAIQDGLSFGGSADLLIVFLFLKHVHDYLNESTLSIG